MNKASVVKHTLIHTGREEAGLGSLPEAFYINVSESINSAINKKYSSNTMNFHIPQFTTKLNKLVEDQQREVEKVVISCGNYCL